MNLSRKTKILLGLIVLINLGLFIGYKIMYKPHQVVAIQQAAFTGLAEDFKKEVAQNPEKWQNAIIQLEGIITGSDEQGVMMNETIYCQFINLESLQSLSLETPTMIKGRFIGYDDLLEEIKLDKCDIIKD